jgi:hypothetical protein
MISLSTDHGHSRYLSLGLIECSLDLICAQLPRLGEVLSARDTFEALFIQIIHFRRHRWLRCHDLYRLCQIYLVVESLIRIH